MPILTTAIINFIVIIVTGIVIGVLLHRGGRSWLGRTAASLSGVGDATWALVGIAGAFMGFHISVILGLLPSPLMHYIGAVLGAVLTLWLWRR